MTPKRTRQPVDPKSPEATRILRHLTRHPCPNPAHRGMAYSRLVVVKDHEGEPHSRFTDGQILFYGCVACQTETATQQVAQCPPEHRTSHRLEILANPANGNPVIFPVCDICQITDPAHEQ